MRKKLLTFCMCFLLLIATACGSKSETNQNETKKDTGTDEKKVIQVLVPGYDSGYLKDQLDSRIEIFEKENSDIDIEIVSVGWDELNSKVVQFYQSKKAPDIMLLGSRSLRQFAEAGILEDVSQYMTKEKMDTYIPNVLDTGKVNGVQYGIPMAFSSRGLFYRSDMISTPPATWDELLALAKDNTKDNMKGFAIPTDLTSGTDEILNFIYQGGGRIVDEEGNFVINSEENVKTLEFLSQLKEYIPDPVGTARKDQSQMFVNDDLAMFISGGWEKETLDANKEKTPYQVAMLPKGEKEGVTLVTDSYTMSSISENKEEAYRFLDFMTQLEHQKVITGSYGWFPVLKGEEDNPIYSDEFNAPMYEIIQHGMPEPQVPNWDEFNKNFLIAVQKVLTGELTAKEALDECQNELTK